MFSKLARKTAFCCTIALLGACGRFSSAPPKARAGGSIVVGLPEIGTLDPARASSPSALALLRTACDGLIGLDYRSGALKPALATGWTLSDKGRKLTITLRQGMKFQDGSPVTPEAVREALSRVARPSTSSPWAWLVSNVDGFKEVQSGAATHLSGVKVMESSMLSVTFSQPFSGFATVLAHPALMPVSLKSLRSDPEGADLPVCAGPYRIEEGAAEKDLRLGKVSGADSRNDGYVHAGEGSADLILIRSFESGEDAYEAYLTGQVDIAPVPSSRAGEAQADPGFRSLATSQIVYLAFDTSNPATADPRFRQAISLAIDRLAILDAAFGDQRLPATGWLPETYAPQGTSACGSYLHRIADPVKARQLLADAGGGPKSGLALYYDPGTTRGLVAEALQLQIEQVLGVKVKPSPLDGQDIVTHFKTRPAGPSAWLMTTRIDIPLEDEFLGVQPDSDPAGNPLLVSDPAFVKQVAEARSATSPADIERHYSLAEGELCKQMPGIPLWTGVSRWMFSPQKVQVESKTYLDSLGLPLLRQSFRDRVISRKLPATLLALALLAPACGGGGPSTGGQAGNALIRVAITDPGVLDPAKANKPSAFLVLKQLCDTLVSFNPSTGDLTPAIAESWTVSDDAKKFTFKLRPGVRFQNGRELVSDDYVYSLNRAADPKTGSPNAVLLEKVAGYKELRQGSATTLSGVQAPGPRILEIDLSEPDAEFAAVMTHVAVGAPVPKEVVDSSPDGYAAHPTCTGPYRIDTSAPVAGRLDLVKFDGYYGANGAFTRGGSGYANRITFTTTPSLQESYKFLDSGLVDVAQISNSDLINASRVKGRVESRENGLVSYLGFPANEAPYDSAATRRELAQSIDREKIIDGLLGGSRANATGMLPLSAGPVASSASCPELAGKPIAKAKPPESLLVTGVNIYLNSGGGHESWLQAVARDWDKNPGVKSVLRTMDWGPYIDYLRNQGAAGPFRLSWAVSYPSPEAMLGPLFTTASPDNLTRYSSKDFDALMVQARGTIDDGRRAEIYADAAKQLCKDVPILPVWFGLNHVAFASKVGSAAAAKERLDIFGDPILRELTMG